MWFAAGILLGLSLLGWVLPDMAAVLFPPESMGTLGLVSQFGLVLVNRLPLHHVAPMAGGIANGEQHRLALIGRPLKKAASPQGYQLTKRAPQASAL